MKFQATAFMTLLMAAPLAAQPPINIVSDSCLILVAHMKIPEALRSDVSVYADGLLTGAQVTSGLSRTEIEARIISACLPNPTLGIRYVLDRAAVSTK